MREDYEVRSVLAQSEDNSTVFTFSDWTSASKLKNSVNPLLRVDIGVLRTLTEDTNEIIGYQLTVYNVNTQAIVYKFYVNYIEEHIYSMTTDEAISFLNYIGFNCEYHEPITLTDNTREVLKACLTLGYTHIARDKSDFILLSGINTERAEFVSGTNLKEVLARSNKKVNLYDLRFIPKSLIPMSISELLKN